MSGANLISQEMTDLLHQFSPHLTDQDVAAILTSFQQRLPEIGVVSKGQILVFMAQTGYESLYYTAKEENLNYRAQGLLAEFPSHFTAAEVESFAHHPMAIANRVYANRYGNGNEASGDGWKYRGRGYIGITFHDNYLEFSHDYKLDFSTVTDYCETIDGATRCACWYWQKHNLQTCDSAASMLHATRVIQGSEDSNSKRMAVYNRLAVLMHEPVA